MSFLLKAVNPIVLINDCDRISWVEQDHIHFFPKDDNSIFFLGLKNRHKINRGFVML